MIDKILRAIYPATCICCEKIVNNGGYICRDCKNKIKIIKEPKCQKCGKPLLSDEKLWCYDCKSIVHEFTKGVSVFQYDDVFKKTMYRFKYDNAREYGNFFGMTASRVYRQLFKEWGVKVIVPVPMHYKKEIERGYNQAKVFGRYLSNYTGLPYDDRFIIRKKATLPQKELSGEIRKINLQKAFAVDKGRTGEYKRVLLVDDIYTTGSTIDACASVLKKAGVEEVYFVCVSTGRDKSA